MTLQERGTAIVLAMGAAGQAVLTTIGLSGLAIAAYNFQRNAVGIGGNPVREPASWGLLIILGSGLIVAVSALARSRSPLRAAVVTQAVTAVIAGVIMTIGVFVYLFTSGSLVVGIIAVVLICGAAAVTAIVVHRRIGTRMNA